MLIKHFVKKKKQINSLSILNINMFFLVWKCFVGIPLYSVHTTDVYICSLPSCESESESDFYFRLCGGAVEKVEKQKSDLFN